MTIDREQIFKVRLHLDALRDKCRTMAKEATDLAQLLAEYEKTGDHNHGGRNLKPGEGCPGGDCYVAKTRTLIEALVAFL